MDINAAEYIRVFENGVKPSHLYLQIHILLSGISVEQLNIIKNELDPEIRRPQS